MPVAQEEPEAEESVTGVSLPGLGLATSLPSSSLPTALSLLPLPTEKVVYWPVPACTSPSALGWPTASSPSKGPLAPFR